MKYFLYLYFFLSASTLNSCNGYQMLHASTNSANTICKCILFFSFIWCVLKQALENKIAQKNYDRIKSTQIMILNNNRLSSDWLCSLLITYFYLVIREFQFRLFKGARNMKTKLEIKRGNQISF